jgi:predicted MPP superfamily phosphohydrolase
MNPAWLTFPFALYPVWEAVHLRRRETVLSYPDLPRPWDGLKLLFLSDSHIAHNGRRERRLRRMLEGEETDLLLFGGDVATGARGYEIMLAATQGVTVRMGRYAVWGNSENLKRVSRKNLKRILADRGVTLLNNDRRILEREGRPVALCGVNCPYSRKADLDAALGGLDEGLFRILLMHAPEGLLSMGSRRADLILSGHTHGGQIRLPGLKAFSVHTETEVDLDRGIFDAAALRKFWPGATDSARMLVGTGIGTSTLPIRLFCPPEIWKITLSAG